MKARPACYLFPALALFAFMPSWRFALTQSNSPNTAQADVYAIETRAMKAYQEKNYVESVRLFDVAFAAGLNRSGDFYNAACSAALASNATKAIGYLERAARSGYRDPDHMKADTDLESLRSTAQYQNVLSRVSENQHAYEVQHSDPEHAAIVTTDIDLFWNTMDGIKSTPDPIAALQNSYFRRGSPGLQDFIFARIGSAANLWNMIKSAPKYYAALRVPSTHIKDFTPQIRGSFRKLKDLYPPAVFPDVYFLIGRMNSAGTTGDSGLLVGADMFGKATDVPIEELDEWSRNVIQPVAAIPGTVAHELIHYQQKTEGKTLLAAAIHEGSADFIGELISGEMMNQGQRTYGLQYEAELWAQFSKDMRGTDISHWMYEGKVVNGRPADLAYFMGYRISQAYYQKASDKKKAIADILNFEDAGELLRASGYPEKFKTRDSR